MKNKILGCLVGGATGDAMGAPTELRTREQIYDKFGGYVTEFFDPPTDTFARGGSAGEVTDDFSLAYVTCQTIIKNDGKVTSDVAKEALIEWSKQERFFERFAGPTTRAAIQKMKGIEMPEALPFVPVNDNTKATNGLGMKMAPIALFSNGDIDKAVENACIIGMLTHDNQIALSAGCAIAAATSCAMREDATLFDVVQAGLYGAKKGEEWGEENAKVLAGPNVYERMKLAINIGLQAKDLSEAIDELADIIGSGLAAAEAIPTVFGLLVASKGNTLDGIHAGVNIGSDTDTVATMVGGILGTLNGLDSLPSDYKKFLEEKNQFDFDELADGIARYLK